MPLPYALREASPSTSAFVLGFRVGSEAAKSVSSDTVTTLSQRPFKQQTSGGQVSRTFAAHYKRAGRLNVLAPSLSAQGKRSPVAPNSWRIDEEEVGKWDSRTDRIA